MAFYGGRGPWQRQWNPYHQGRGRGRFGSFSPQYRPTPYEYIPRTWDQPQLPFSGPPQQMGTTQPPPAPTPQAVYLPPVTQPQVTVVREPVYIAGDRFCDLPPDQPYRDTSGGWHRDTRPRDPDRDGERWSQPRRPRSPDARAGHGRGKPDRLGLSLQRIESKLARLGQKSRRRSDSSSESSPQRRHRPRALRRDISADPTTVVTTPPATPPPGHKDTRVRGTKRDAVVGRDSTGQPEKADVTPTVEDTVKDQKS